MNVRTRIQSHSWLAALLLAAVLGSQLVQAAHVHADHLQGADCLQCKLESGHALLPEPARVPAVAAAPAVTIPQATAEAVVTVFRLLARGPPTLSA